jgi:hypothetical protein
VVHHHSIRLQFPAVDRLLVVQEKKLLLVNIIFIHNQRIIHVFQMHTHNRNFHSLTLDFDKGG